LGGSTLNSFLDGKNQTAMYFLRSRLFTTTCVLSTSCYEQYDMHKLNNYHIMTKAPIIDICSDKNIIFVFLKFCIFPIKRDNKTSKC